MAETSGFFEARLNEETEEYDRLYYAEQFANYFKLFIGNGVFIQNSNQLQVESVAGMNIKVNPGWGFINGYWYNNSEGLNITIPVNTFTVDRYDLVVLRKDLALREISIVYLENETNIRRDGNYYDLALAKIRIPVGSASISNSNITDKRPDEEVCGFVKGLVDIITTDALFNQFTAQFNEWFTDIKEKLEEDPAGNLQAQIGNLGELVTVNKDNLVESINEVVDKIDNLSAKDIGLGNVNNTADKDKSVKYAESAGSATKATQDGNGNNIDETYATRDENDETNPSKAIYLTGNINSLIDDYANVPPYVFGHIEDSPTSTYWNLVETIRHDGFVAQIAYGYGNIATRWFSDNTWTNWSKINGKADSAINDGQGRNIVDTYATKGEVLISKTAPRWEDPLSTYTTTGVYHIPYGGQSDNPSKGHGTLFVDGDIGTLYQIWIPDSSYNMHKRISNDRGNTWEAWVTICSQKGIEFQIVNGELQYRYDTEVWG